MGNGKFIDNSDNIKDETTEKFCAIKEKYVHI